AAALNRDAAIKTLLDHGANPRIVTKALKLPKPAPRSDDAMPEEKHAKPAPAHEKESEPDQKAALEALAHSIGLKADVYAAGNPADNAGDVKGRVQTLNGNVDELQKRLTVKKIDTEDNNNNNFSIVRERRTRDMNGITALLFAARGGHMEAARALLEGGADI